MSSHLSLTAVLLLSLSPSALLAEECDLRVEIGGHVPYVEPGEYFGFAAEAINECDVALDFDLATMEISGPADYASDLYRGAPITVMPYSSIGKPVSLFVPYGTPSGTYTVAVNLYRGDLLLDSDSLWVDCGTER